MQTLLITMQETSYEVSKALLNAGYKSKGVTGFTFNEINDILHKKYNGSLVISFMDQFKGFVAFFDDEQVFDTTKFDLGTSISDALGSLLLILDNKFKENNLSKD